MPNSNDEERLSILTLNEETGVVELSLPAYEQDEAVTYASVLFMMLAQKITNDAEWCNALVVEAEDEAAKSTEH